MYLPYEKLQQISGQQTPGGVALWLKILGIPFNLDGKKRPCVMDCFSHMVVGKTPACVESLIGSGTMFSRDEPGVYILRSSGTVIYVGMTKSLFARMEKHIRAGYHFDQVEFIRTSPEHAALLETELIARLRPTLNVAKVGGGTTITTDNRRKPKGVVRSKPSVPQTTKRK